MAKAPNKLIGVYQIGECIGKGASGKVYKGLNTENAKIVAIKQVSISNISDEQLNSIHMEIHLLKKLSHENIVRYIDAISTEKHLNIVLEYVETGSLAAINKKFGPFHETLVSIYIKQVLTGLAYLHSQGIVHRDIKGANILTTKEGIVKLTDFGVATKLSETTKSMSVVGTPYWMAPEIAYPTGPTTFACDIWSLGCTVLELLTGAPPHYDLEPMQALYRIVQDPSPPLPSSISIELRDFLIKCFQKEPLIRVDASTLLKHPWITQKTAPIVELNMPEEVSNTIRNHIESIVEVEEKQEIDEDPESCRSSSPLGHRRTRAKGSFRAQEPQVEEKASKTARTISKSTRIESDDFNSVNSCMQRLRESRCLSVVSEKVSFIEIYSIVNELVPGNSCIVSTILQILDILRLNPGQKIDNIVGLMKDIFEEVEDFDILKHSLVLISQLCESDEEYKIQISVLGLLPLTLRYVGEEYLHELRCEAGYLVGVLCNSSWFIRKLFLSGGGLECIPKLIDRDYESNKNLVLLGIDCMLMLIEINYEDFIRVWAGYNVIERLLISIDNIFQAGENKLCDLLIKFARGPRYVQEKFCDSENLRILSNYLNFVPPVVKLKLVKVIKCLSSENLVQNKLENSGIVVDLVNVLSTTHLEFQYEIVYTCLRSLSYLLKLSASRQEQLVLAGGVPFLKEALFCGKSCEELSIDLLQSIPTASNYCSKIMHSYEILTLLISYLPNYPRILDGITKWIGSDSKRCTIEMVKQENLQALIELFASAQNFDHVLQCFIRILTSSEPIAVEISKSHDFLNRLAREVSQNSQPQLVKNCLDLLLHISSKHPKPRELLDKYSMYPVIVNILHQSHDKDRVVVEEIATMLLEVYSNKTCN
ncbi:hypothetical protein SteCoe_36535 [Stentor coeruleus]|uniref:non-specific serine/threonine protein kinase n=1 Tax=Stentor coeruleus TaxID=5963 RepID=A0A1R2APV2_9CILI|nr:hypothetical protein SteCoe_36535 [Stentor coeruleus]